MRLNHIKELNPFLRSLLYIIGGDIAIYVGMELLNSEAVDITDEDITENIKESIEGTDIDFEPDDSEILKLNTVRKTLYKLYSEKLAQFRRIRDKLQFEQNNYFFICKNCQESNIKHNFDEAFELNFRCPECGNPLEAQDNQSIIEYLKIKIGAIQNIKISID